MCGRPQGCKSFGENFDGRIDSDHVHGLLLRLMTAAPDGGPRSGPEQPSGFADHAKLAHYQLDLSVLHELTPRATPSVALMHPIASGLSATGAHKAVPDVVQSGSAWRGAVVALLRFHRLAAEPAQVVQALGSAAPLRDGTVRYLRRAGLRSRAVSPPVQRLASVPLPAVAPCDDGSWVLPARATGDRVLIFDPHTQQPKLLLTPRLMR
jgi:hypothetical protein